MDGKAVGRRIKAAREARHLTQEELAARIDISPTHVSVIERGTKIPRLDTFVGHRQRPGGLGGRFAAGRGGPRGREPRASEPVRRHWKGLPWEEKRRILKVVRIPDGGITKGRAEGASIFSFPMGQASCDFDKSLPSILAL